MKIVREWVEQVLVAETPKKMVELITSNNDIHLAALCKELSERESW
jgi:hypothetical protein